MQKLEWTNLRVKLGELKPWADNPHFSTKAQAERLIKQLDELGQFQTLSVGPNLEVYDGHQRLRFYLLLDFYKSVPALSVAFAQNGDFIGGENNKSMAGKIALHRKCMNTFLCSSNRQFSFIGRINEDVNTYARLGNVGKLFFTVPLVAVIQQITQKSENGMTELYTDLGTYAKSFYSVMYCPSFVKVGTIGYLYRRIHHRITWKNAVPQIVSES